MSLFPAGKKFDKRFASGSEKISKGDTEESNYHLISFSWQDNGIKCDLQDVMKLDLPNVRYPWTQ